MEASAPRPFSQFLIEQRTGGLHNELSERLAELAAAVADHQRSGTLTLTIQIKPVGKALGTYEVTDEVKIKAPHGDRGASLFFADAHGNLSRSDPRQPQLPLHDAATPIREAN